MATGVKTLGAGGAGQVSEATGQLNSAFGQLSCGLQSGHTGQAAQVSRGSGAARSGWPAHCGSHPASRKSRAPSTMRAAQAGREAARTMRGPQALTHMGYGHLKSKKGLRTTDSGPCISIRCWRRHPVP